MIAEHSNGLKARTTNPTSKDMPMPTTLRLEPGHRGRAGARDHSRARHRPAVAMHEGSTLLGVFNALRLLALRDTFKQLPSSRPRRRRPALLWFGKQTAPQHAAGPDGFLHVRWLTWNQPSCAQVVFAALP